MSKAAAFTLIAAALVVGACSKRAPAPEPMPAPIMAEPVSIKGK